MKKIILPLVALVALTLGCRSMGIHSYDASAAMEARSDSRVGGTVKLTKLSDNRLRVQVDIAGVEPNSRHGLHVHETGDCSAADASSAGPHFNPTGGHHAGRDDSNRHTGDFGNVTADAAGEIHDTFDVTASLVSGEEKSILGRAIVLHADPDDLTSQPAGNSGKRIGCGVIRLAD